MNLLAKHFDTALDTPDGIKKLRELILTLAMQGKLVPQYPTDQPASELLKEIEADKKKLVKERKLQSINLNEIFKANSKNITLPINWVVVNLAQLAHVQPGYAFKSSNFNTNKKGLPIIRIRDVGQKFTGTFFDGEYNSEFIVNFGDYLISMDGEFRIAKWQNGKALLNQRVARLIFYSKKLEQPYIATCLKFKLQEYQGTKSYTTVDHLSSKQILSSKIPLPPLSEQKRIVDKIDELMALCDQLEARKSERDQKRLTVHSVALNKLLSAPDQVSFDSAWQFITRHFNELYSVKENVAELRKAILQLAVMGKLVPQDPTDQPASELLKEIEAEKKRLVKEGKIKNQEPLPLIKPEEIPYSLPKSWEWVRLGGIVKHDRDVTYGIVLMGGEPKRGGIKVLRCSDVKFRKLDIQSVRGVEEAISSQYARTIIKGGEILMNIRGTLGGCAIATTEVIGFNIAREIALIVINDSIFNRYILDVLTSQITQSAIQSNLRGIAYKGLNLNLLRNFLIPLPPLAEQKRIVEKVDQLMALCDQLENQIGKASLKQSELLGAVLAGG